MLDRNIIFTPSINVLGVKMINVVCLFQLILMMLNRREIKTLGVKVFVIYFLSSCIIIDCPFVVQFATPSKKLIRELSPNVTYW